MTSEKLAEYPDGFPIGEYSVKDQEIKFSPNGRNKSEHELYLKEQADSKPHTPVKETYTQAGILE